MNNMKKSDALMFAYVCFLLLSVALRVVIDYPVWHSLVLAVSFTSMFFAVANLLEQDAKELETLYTAQALVFAPLIQEFSNLQFCSSFVDWDVNNQECPNEKKQDKILSQTTDTNQQLALRLLWENANNNKMKADSEKERLWSKKLTFWGFLILLLIIILPNVSLPTEQLEQLSVFSFAIVLMQYIFDDQLSQRLDRRLKKAKQLADECEMVIQQEKLRREKNSHAD